jgi:Ca2+-binding RTX toxin-like protein
MRKGVLLLASTTVAVLLACGVALAAEVTCPTGDNGLCEGTEEGDTLTGTSDVDTINALGGNDVLIGGGARDRLDGGRGNDRYVYTDLSEFLSEPRSHERITADESGVDTLDFARLPQEARGEFEFRTINSHAWHYVSGGGSSTGIVYFENGAIENVLGGAGPEDVTALDDVSHLVRLGAGEDRFFGRDNGGEDAFYGGPGNDYASAGHGRDRLFGATGDDYLRGYVGNQLVDGGPGADTLLGGGNSDRLRAADGEADEVIDCGAGVNDRVFYDVGLDPEPVGCEVVLNPQ